METLYRQITKKLIRSLEYQCMAPDLILETIAQATPEERQAILNNHQLMSPLKKPGFSPHFMPATRLQKPGF